MTREMIAHEELVAREDLALNHELIPRINAVRASIRNQHALSAADATAVHDLLGDCAQTLVDALYQNQRNQMRKHIIEMTLNLMSIAPVPLAAEIEMMPLIPVANEAGSFVAA